MSAPQYYVYKGKGEWLRDNLGYSQAVRVGDRIEISGQGECPLENHVPYLTNVGLGGWEPYTETMDFPENIADEIAQAFRNVDLVLKTAGGKGWSQVYRVNSYHTELNMDVTAIMTENFRKYMPNHQPIWTEIGVRQLGAPKMNVEIEVIAYDPQK